MYILFGVECDCKLGTQGKDSPNRDLWTLCVGSADSVLLKQLMIPEKSIRFHPHTPSIPKRSLPHIY